MADEALTLEDLALRFLTSLPTEERTDTQQEVNRFVLWYGKERSVSHITPTEVETYAQWTAASTGDVNKKLEPVRAMLTYAKKERLLKTSLAPHLRIKQAHAKGAMARKPKQQIALTANDHAELKTQLAALEEERVVVAEDHRLRENLSRHIAGRLLLPALGGLPLALEEARPPQAGDQDAPEPLKPEDLPRLTWEALARQAGRDPAGAVRWQGRSAVLGGDPGSWMVVKLARRGESLDGLRREVRWMGRLGALAPRLGAAFHVPRPLSPAPAGLLRLVAPPPAGPRPRRCRGRPRSSTRRSPPQRSSISGSPT